MRSTPESVKYAYDRYISGKLCHLTGLRPSEIEGVASVHTRREELIRQECLLPSKQLSYETEKANLFHNIAYQLKTHGTPSEDKRDYVVKVLLNGIRIQMAFDTQTNTLALSKGKQFPRPVKTREESTVLTGQQQILALQEHGPLVYSCFGITLDGKWQLLQKYTDTEANHGIKQSFVVELKKFESMLVNSTSSQ